MSRIPTNILFSEVVNNNPQHVFILRCLVCSVSRQYFLLRLPWLGLNCSLFNENLLARQIFKSYSEKENKNLYLKIFRHIYMLTTYLNARLALQNRSPIFKWIEGHIHAEIYNVFSIKPILSLTIFMLYFGIDCRRT